MSVAGIIAEFNPLHMGHIRLFEKTRKLLGTNTAIICVMSGDFVQRGDFAIVRRQARAKAAIQNGADLIIELPLPWAVASAEGFAQGAIQILAATGLVDYLIFGSECGNIRALQNAAAVLTSPLFPDLLREELLHGISFPAARQKAAERLQLSPDILRRPNNILGVEYCKSLRILSIKSITPVTFLRKEDALPRSSDIRALLHDKKREEALSYMSTAMQQCYLEEEEQGQAPVFFNAVERAILSKLRSMTREQFSMLDMGHEGLYNRLYQASRKATSVTEILKQVKTKRYVYAYLRRMVLWSYLGITPKDRPDFPPYLRPLAMNQQGRQLLAYMKKSAKAPILTKAGDVKKLSDPAKKLFAIEARAADLYSLAYPNLKAAIGGTLWTTSPWIEKN